MSDEIDYETVLADLKEKRARLDSAIAAVEQLLIARATEPAKAIHTAHRVDGEPQREPGAERGTSEDDDELEKGA